LHRAVFCLLIGLLSSLLPGCQAAQQEEQSKLGEERHEQGKSRSIAGRGTNVFLVVFDAASAEFFTSYGAGSRATPNIRKLARDGVVFETAYGQTATTDPSVASLITGLRATTHPVKPDAPLPGELPTAAAMSGENGYHSYAVFGNPMAGAPQIGLDRGYDESVDAYRLQPTHDNPTLAHDHRTEQWDLIRREPDRASDPRFMTRTPRWSNDPRLLES
jgi:arylsulfatase A-like enzyme